MFWRKQTPFPVSGRESAQEPRGRHWSVFILFLIFFFCDENKSNQMENVSPPICNLLKIVDEREGLRVASPVSNVFVYAQLLGQTDSASNLSYLRTHLGSRSRHKLAYLHKAAGQASR